MLQQLFLLTLFIISASYVLVHQNYFRNWKIKVKYQNIGSNTPNKNNSIATYDSKHTIQSPIFDEFLSVIPRCSGLMYKEGKNIHSWKQRYFILNHNDQLSYYKRKFDQQPIHSIDVKKEGIKIERDKFSEDYKFGIKFTTNDRIWKFVCSTNWDANNWIYQINKAGNELLIKHDSIYKIDDESFIPYHFGWLYLAPEILIIGQWKKKYFKLQQDGILTISDAKDTKIRSIINIKKDGIKIERVSFGKTDDIKYGIKLKTKQKEWKFAASTNSDANEWMKCINLLSNRTLCDYNVARIDDSEINCLYEGDVMLCDKKQHFKLQHNGILKGNQVQIDLKKEANKVEKESFGDDKQFGMKIITNLTEFQFVFKTGIQRQKWIRYINTVSNGKIVDRDSLGNDKIEETDSCIIIAKGWMDKEGNNIKSWKTRYFRLYKNGILSYSPEASNIVKAIAKIDIKNDAKKIERASFGNDKEFGIKLTTKHREWKFICKNAVQVSNWIRLMNSTI